MNVTLFWLIWAALVVVAVFGLFLILLSARHTVRAEGFGRVRMHRGPGASAYWSGMAILVADVVLIFVFAYAFSA